MGIPHGVGGYIDIDIDKFPHYLVYIVQYQTLKTLNMVIVSLWYCTEGASSRQETKFSHVAASLGIRKSTPDSDTAQKM